MGDMTLTEMETEIRANLGGRTDLDSRLVTFINWSQTAIARRGNFKELRNYVYGTYTVADQEYITLPSGTKNLLAIVLLDGVESRKLTYVPIREFYRYIPKPDEYTTRKPTHYTLFSTTVRLYPVPDDAYELYFYRDKWPTALSGASDTSDIMSLDEVLVAYATSRAYRSLKMMEPSLYWKGIGDEILNEALKTDKGPFADEEILPGYALSTGGPVYYEDPLTKRMP